MNRKLKICLILCIIGICLILGLKFIFPLLAPFLLGVIFACLIEPSVMFLERRFHFKRRLATVVILSVLVVTVLTVVSLTTVFTYLEVQRLLVLIPTLTKKVSGFFDYWFKFLHPVFPGIGKVIVKLYFNPEIFSQIIRSLLLGLFYLLSRFPHILLLIFLGAVSAYFFSSDKLLFSGFIYKLLPSGWLEPVQQLKTEVTGLLAKFIRAEFGLVLITVIVTGSCFSLFSIPGAAAYAFLAGILDFIPVLGPGLIYLPVICSCFWVGNYIGAIGTICGYFIILLIHQLVEVRIIGKNINIHPLVTLGVIYLGMKLFGFMGFFLGPTLIIALRGCYRVLVSNRTFV